MTHRVAIMQPYFFPYLGYFSLLKHTDRFILLDSVQFIRHGWIERNRILRRDGGWLYIRVPLMPHSRDTLIQNIEIDNAKNWKRSMLSQLEAYRRIAPHYGPVVEVVRSALDTEHRDITSLDRATLEAMCDYLGMPRTLEVFSEMDLGIQPAAAPDEWALNICMAIGNVQEYWNPPGGRDFFDRAKYERAGIGLEFLSVNLREYDQRRGVFEPGLSIIDVAMFNSPEEIHAMLDDYDLLDGIDRSPKP